MKSFIVLGLGRFGRSIAKTLYQLGHEVLGVDDDEKIVQEFEREITHTVQADLTNEHFLKSMEVHEFDAAVVAVGSNLQVSIMATVMLKELGARYIVVKAQDDFEGKVLYKVGADKVIFPEKDMGIKVARNLATENFFDMIEISESHSIVSIKPPSPWIGKTLGELAVRARYGINVIAIKGEGKHIIPSAQTVVDEQSVWIVMGTNSDIKRLNSISQ